MAEDSIPAPSRAAKPFHGSCEDAKAAGAVRYIDGIPCGRGHIPTIRLASNMQCVTCRDMKHAELKIATKAPEDFAPDLFVGQLSVYVGSRAKAGSAGAKYYTNPRRPCTGGHIPTIRLVSNSACIHCAHEYHDTHKETINRKKRQAWVTNPEPFRAKLRERYAENPEYFKRNSRSWQIRNPERSRLAYVTWKANNVAYLKAYWFVWFKANPDKAAAKSHKRRAAKLGSTEHFTAADIQEIFALQRGRCACCRSKLKAVEARDHIVALARGGNNGRRNIQITCQPCNSRKGARDPIDFMRAEFGRLL